MMSSIELRPYQRLPFPAPKDFDPGIEDPSYFYNNFVKPSIPDMIQMMDTGLCIDQDAVEDLRKTITTVLLDVKNKLKSNSLIQRFQTERLPAAQKAYTEKCTQSVRTVDFYVKEFNDKDVLHRTWIVNTYLRKLGRPDDTEEKWILKDLKQYNIFLNDSFVSALIKKRRMPNNLDVLAGMKALAEYKLSLWNKPRYEASKVPVILEDFNPGSNKQVKELFEMLSIAPLAFSKDTGNASWGREQIEELQKITTDKDLLKVLKAMVDFSYSDIMRTNFLKAFDTFTIDGVLHGNIKLFGAKSYRPTSNSPNLLNAPSTGSVYAKPLKRCFIAPEGYIIYTADLKALEDRVIANLSEDKNKCNVFLEDLDGHSLNSCVYFAEEIAKVMGPNNNNIEYVREFFRLYDEVEDKVIDAIRFRSKAPTFKLAYGGYPDIDKGGVITQEIFDNYHNVLYPGITKYREKYVLPTARKQGYIHLGLGCRLYTDDARSHIRTLNNATAQFWSILTLIAINEFNYRIREDKLEKEIQVISTIYDSVYTQCLKDSEIIKWVNDNLIEVMCVHYLDNEIVHNEAEGFIGNNWAELHKIKNNSSLKSIQTVMDKL